MSHTARDHKAFLPRPDALLHTWRKLGPLGPAYHIAEALRVLDNGDTVFLVSMPRPVGDDARFERLFSEILSDPEAD